MWEEWVSLCERERESLLLDERNLRVELRELNVCSGHLKKRI